MNDALAYAFGKKALEGGKTIAPERPLTRRSISRPRLSNNLASRSGKY